MKVYNGATCMFLTQTQRLNASGSILDGISLKIPIGRFRSRSPTKGKPSQSLRYPLKIRGTNHLEFVDSLRTLHRHTLSIGRARLLAGRPITGGINASSIEDFKVVSHTPFLHSASQMSISSSISSCIAMPFSPTNGICGFNALAWFIASR